MVYRHLLLPKGREAFLDNILHAIRMAQVMERIQAQRTIVHPESKLYFF